MVLRAEGPHNAQNACGAAALTLTFGFDAATVAAGLAKVSPAFGRGQTFGVDGRQVTLQLVKNPAGFRQTLRTLDAGIPDAVVIAINDDYADGRDVSWLWDVDFGALAALPSRRSTSGTRAADMAVRLRYDDVAVDEIEPDLEKAVRAAVAAVPSGGPGRRVQHLHRHVGAARRAGTHGIAGGCRVTRPLTLVHLYPREMNIYGDTGNVMVLRKRLQWRGLPVEVVPVSVGDPLPADPDILLGGGGQDAAQGEIGQDFTARGPDLRAMADDGVVMLTICGSFQMLGHEFVTQEGVRIPGVGVLDVTTHGQPVRLIGNNFVDTPDAGRLVGYENHSGLTTLGPGRATARHARRPAGATTARTAARARCATTSSAPTCTGRCWPRARASPTSCCAAPTPAAATRPRSSRWTTRCPSSPRGSRSGVLADPQLGSRR